VIWGGQWIWLKFNMQIGHNKTYKMVQKTHQISL